MDKFKKFLTVLKKYHFWVTCVVILLVAIACWWTATAGLASQFQKRKSTLEGQFTSVKNIKRNDPNDKVIEAIRGQQTKLKEEVWKAWEILYTGQKEKNPFPKVLGEEFKQQFENLKPNEDLPRRYREVYQNYISKYLPKLLEVVNIRRPVEETETAKQDDKPAKEKQTDKDKQPAKDKDKQKKPATDAGRTRRTTGVAGGRGLGMGMPGMGGNADSETEWTGIVDWSENDIKALEARFEWNETPSTLAVVLAQEDLWVVGALLRVIARSNEGASGPATAAVKQILALQIGREAINAKTGSEETIFKSSAGGAGGMGGMGGMEGGGMGMPGRGMGGPGMGGPGMGGPGMGGPGMGGGMMGPGGMGGMGGGMGGMGGPGGTAGAGGSMDQMLIEGRYVDDKGMPLTSKSEYPYAEHPYAEFKMMPVRMNLVMDQRQLPKLLVECANSSMPIEVKRVRILKTQGGATESSTRGAAAGMRGGMGMEGLMGGRGMGGGRAAVQTVDPASEAGSHDVPVEIYGVIYIYNPPDRTKLGTGAASQEKPAEGAAPGEPGTPPAGTPAKPPAPAGAMNPYRKQGVEA